MGTESKAWGAKIRPAFKRWRCHPVRIENSAALGTPDINTTFGWIELKHIKAWPKREATEVKLYHFTPLQRNFLRTRWKTNNGAWLLLTTDLGEYLLFDGETAANKLGKVTKAVLLELCLCYTKEIDDLKKHFEVNSSNT